MHKRVVFCDAKYLDACALWAIAGLCFLLDKKSIYASHLLRSKQNVQQNAPIA